MNRLAAALAALLITGVIAIAAVAGVRWLMTSHTLWAIAREPWFEPSVIMFNILWPGIWLPLYISRINRKKAEAPGPSVFIRRHSA